VKGLPVSRSVSPGVSGVSAISVRRCG
jgi:hypothetical protein